MDMARERDWPEGYTARVIKNAFTHYWHGREDELEEELDRVIPEYQEAWDEGDTEYANVFVGEATGLIHDIKPAAEIIEDVVAEASRIITKQQGMVT